jgi:DNA-binding NarL/FixJ family response regulator
MDTEPVRGSRGAERRVLVVDDRRALALELCRQLDDLGYKATTLPAPPDTLADLGWPRKPALAVIGKSVDGPRSLLPLADQLRGAGVPLVLLAGEREATDIDMVQRLEPLGVLIPPVTIRQLRLVLGLAHAQHERFRSVVRQLERATHVARAAEGQRSVLERRLAEIGALVSDGMGDLVPAPPGAESEEKLAPWRTVLSRREFDVLHAFIIGRRVDRVTRMLDLSPSTVRNHLKSIYRKSGVHSQAELIDAVNRGQATKVEEPEA